MEKLANNNNIRNGREHVTRAFTRRYRNEYNLQESAFFSWITMLTRLMSDDIGTMVMAQIQDVLIL
jgi:hypothetical protein